MRPPVRLLARKARSRLFRGGARFRAWVAVGLLVAASACGGCGPDRTRALEDLKADTPERRADGLRRLGKVASDEDFLLFAKAATDPAAVVRRAAVETLGIRRDARAVDLAAGLLGDPDPGVQEAAAACLARLPSPKARPYLIESYVRRGPVARAAIARVLAEQGIGPGEPLRAEARHLRERNEAALASGSMAEQVGAAEELGRSGAPEAVTRLRGLLFDPSVMLAAAAARGLGAAGDPAAAEDLIPLLSSQHPELREAAALALGQLGGPAAAEPLARAARVGEPGAIAAALALSRLPESWAAACAAAVSARSPGPAGVLARHAAAEGASCDLSGLEARVRRGGTEALAALAAAGPLRATGLLPLATATAASAATPGELRVAAIRYLGEAGGEAEATFLSGLLAGFPALSPPGARGESAAGPGAAPPSSPARSSEPSPTPGTARPTVPAAASAESAAPAVPAAGPAVRAAASEESAAAPAVPAAGPAVRAAASAESAARAVPAAGPATDEAGEPDDALLATVSALGTLRHAAAVPALAMRLRDPDPDLQVGLVRALGAIGTPEALTAVAGVATGDAPIEARLAAIEVLGRTGGSTAAAALVVAAQGADTTARGAALRALASSGAKVPAGALESFARSGLPEAAVALGWLGYDQARPLLLAALRTPAVAGRAELVEALGRLGDRDAARVIAGELHHDRPEVRVAACGALARLGAGKAREVLAALAAEDYYVDVRRAAARALAAIDGTTPPEGR